MKTNLMPLLACLCLLTLATACDKKENPEPEAEPEPKCKLSRIEEPATFYTYEPYDLVYTYTYDAAGKLQTYNFVGTSTNVFNYENGKLVRQVYTWRDQESTEFLTYYNTQGLVAKQEIYKLGLQYDGGRALFASYKYSYNSSKLCTEVQYFGISNTTTTPDVVYKYSYTNQFPTEIERYTSAGLNYIIKVSYDGKQNPLPASYPLFLTDDNYIMTPLLNLLRQQNIVSYTMLDTDRVTVIKNSSYTATYNYNEFGFPIEQVRTFGNGKTDSRRYYYTCP